MKRFTTVDPFTLPNCNNFYMEMDTYLSTSVVFYIGQVLLNMHFNIFCPFQILRSCIFLFFKTIHLIN